MSKLPQKATSIAYARILSRCKDTFQQKHQDYGSSWRVLRASSITDQILIKAQRIRYLQDATKQQVPDSIEDDFIGIVNYAIIALMQLQLQKNKEKNLKIPYGELSQRYDDLMDDVKALVTKKNHDYQEAWRMMRVSALVDIILMKLMRLQSIEANQGVTLISEGAHAGYQDIINYAIFSLIKLEEHE